MIEYVAFFICVPFYWYFFKFYFHGKESANRALKFVILGLSICLILILPVQIFEYKRQMSIASDHGFVDCPPFTLLSSTYIVEAMVKDPKYCTDDEITSIAMYGYFRELPIVNAYVDEVHGKKSVVN
ncbi:hypothetical protein [Vibrio tapetis]|uniref:hypothetical protein n=1 Tax=Vibrio tapetis TaxID=52443 RepID=UPI001E39321E|nr:hypothetical protein [Vibrio tapetis]